VRAYLAMMRARRALIFRHPGHTTRRGTAAPSPQRESVLGIIGGLPEVALRPAVFPSGWTCPGLIHHLAVDDERYWFRGVAAGEPIEFPADEDSGSLVGPQIAAGEVFRLHREEITSANAIIAATPLEAPARRQDPRWDAWGWPEPAETVNLR
jgi:uncharacterized protein DUF664